ncbi:MAG: phosphoribosylglycinamide formyltransferase [Oligoflexia bacterium]|nr:phosphoribosylglycinamide formyltransferase [Oligoflexia bacterium]MBF0364659.1 phosphoribosylglycinamide formyltransferase [Oligoflexia bacterium]
MKNKTKIKIKIVILISGSGSNLKSILSEQQHPKGCLYDLCDTLLVIGDRVESLPGIEIARSFGVKTSLVLRKNFKTKIAFEEELLAQILPLHPHYIILAGFMSILGKTMLTPFKEKIINIHPADTKLYQGPHGYEWAYKNALSSTKITVHYVDEGIDTGPIIAQHTVALPHIESLSLAQVIALGKEQENKFYPQVISNLFKESKLCVA